MSKILFFDVETEIRNPFDATQMRILEVGMCLYSLEEKAILDSYGFLVHQPNYTHNEMTTSLCGITENMLKNCDMTPEGALLIINKWAEKADYFCAHNAEFDKTVYLSECKRNGVTPVEKIWVDTKVDLPYPKEVETRKLKHLACEYGFLNFYAHRALMDVYAMVKIFQQFDAEYAIKSATSPSVTIKSLLQPPWKGGPANGNDLHKSHGFRFDATNKIWFKTIKEYDLEKERKEIPFATTRI